MAEVTIEVGSDAVAVITMFNPPVNVVTAPLLKRLKEKLDEAARRNDVNAVVITGSGGRFCGGFDIKVVKKIHTTGDVSLVTNMAVDLMVNTIEDSKKPVVAAVEGFAFGGGFELALACHARIAAPRTQLGLTELTLGIIPGFGALTLLIRHPRLAGLQNAIEMMLLAKVIISEEGAKLGLIDAVVPSQELLKASRLWALDIAEARKPWLRSLHRTDKLGSLSEAHKIIQAARQQARNNAPNLPQQLVCLDVIEDGIMHGGYSGVLKEAKVLKEIIMSDTSKGLVHVFFAQRATSKVPGVTDGALKPRHVKKIAVIGGGLMGSGIATALLLRNISVILEEISSEFLLKGIETIEGSFKGLVARGKLAQLKAEKSLSLLKGCLDYSDFGDVDMVIEAVIENIPLKQKMFCELEKVCHSHCILASNTSPIDLNVIGEKTSSQDRIVGADFFSPAHVMPLLEIVRTQKTSAQVILDLLTVVELIKKVPVVVGNCTGFAVNRAFFPYSQGAHILVDSGVDVFRIDRIIKNFGLPMGPFQLQDLAGYGVALAASKEFANPFPDRTNRGMLLHVLVLMSYEISCKKNGKGYYTYEKGSNPKPDLSVLPIIEESRRITKMMPDGKPLSVSDEEILEIILFPVVNEACRILDGVVIRAVDLDIASVLGMSFPSYRGGIVFWGDLVGPMHIYATLKRWSGVYGDFFKPSRLLEERATKGLPLSAAASSATLRSRV